YLDRQGGFNVNKKYLKRILSILLTLTVLFTNSFIVLASNQDMPVQNNNDIQFIKNEIESQPGLYFRLSTDGIAEIYTDEVKRIEANLNSRSGLTYGPWFGGYSFSRSLNLKETMKLSGYFLLIYGAFLSGNASAIVATSFGTLFTADIPKGTLVQSDTRKQYREVKYSNGSFAYWQTLVTVTNVKKGNNYLGSKSVIISGGQW
ncbi:MAG: hypothetical protein RR621_05050, partial [Lachnospiraceae bacterium]